MRLEKAAHISNIISALTGSYCAYASWLLLHPPVKPESGTGAGNMVIPDKLIVIFVVSLCAVTFSATSTLATFLRQKAAKKLENANSQIQTRDSEIQQARQEIEELEKTIKNKATSTASIGDINIHVPVSQANPQSQHNTNTQLAAAVSPAPLPTTQPVPPKKEHNVVTFPSRKS